MGSAAGSLSLSVWVSRIISLISVKGIGLQLPANLRGPFSFSVIYFRVAVALRMAVHGGDRPTNSALQFPALG